jgi:acyl-CoA synthetase (AMP-forming)/AMP-acid ligase II
LAPTHIMKELRVNITGLLLDGKSTAELIHVGNAATRVTRTVDELRANVAALSTALLGFGVGSGDSVLILGTSRVEIVESILATFNIGVTAAPVSPLLGPQTILTIIARMRPRCCIFEDPPAATLQRALAECGCVMIAIKPTPETLLNGWTAYHEIIARRRSPPEFPAHPLDQPALVIHGSGSSGALKAVAMSHERLLTFLEYNQFVFAQYSDGPQALTSSAATLTTLPLSHLAGLGNTLLSLLSGRRTFLLSSFTPVPYLKLLEEARCSQIVLIPSLYRSLLKEPYLRTMDKSALRFCIIGGEPSPPALLAEIEQAFGVPVMTVYSMTECLSGIAHMRHDLFRSRVPPGSCGKQFFGELSLRDVEGAEQPQLGELWVRNATVHSCYLDPALNEDRLRGGWFRTGDLFYRDAHGHYFHRGRVDDMFICNGKNIYPLEIEQVLMAHPAVEMVCAGPVVLRDKGPVPGVVIVARSRVSAAELQEFCMREGPSHAIPQVIQFADDLPLLGPGKVDRRAVQRVLEQVCAPRVVAS